MTTDQIPVTAETRPDARVVDFTRWALERHREQQNQRDAQRARTLRPEPPEAA